MELRSELLKLRNVERVKFDGAHSIGIVLTQNACLSRRTKAYKILEEYGYQFDEVYPSGTGHLEVFFVNA